MRGFGIAVLLSLLLRVDGVATNPSDLIKEVDKANNQSLLWGPYKPNLYFGVRPRIPGSMFAGLMWANVDTYDGIQNSEGTDDSNRLANGNTLLTVHICRA